MACEFCADTILLCVVSLLLVGLLLFFFVSSSLCFSPLVSSHLICLQPAPLRGSWWCSPHPRAANWAILPSAGRPGPAFHSVLFVSIGKDQTKGGERMPARPAEDDSQHLKTRQIKYNSNVHTHPKPRSKRWCQLALATQQTAVPAFHAPQNVLGNGARPTEKGGG